MPIVDEVSAQLKEAMRARDKERTKALRNVRAAFLTALKADGASETLSDDEAQAILRKLAKQHAESIEAYEEGGREDLAEQEKAELLVIEEFLPKLADEAQTRVWVEEAIAATGASSMADMGKVMGRLMGAHKHAIDGKLANQLVREKLQ